MMMDEKTVEIRLRIPEKDAAPASASFPETYKQAAYEARCPICAGEKRVGTHRKKIDCPDCKDTHGVSTGWRDGKSPIVGEHIQERRCSDCAQFPVHDCPECTDCCDDPDRPNWGPPTPEPDIPEGADWATGDGFYYRAFGEYIERWDGHEWQKSTWLCLCGWFPSHYATQATLDRYGEEHKDKGWKRVGE